MAFHENDKSSDTDLNVEDIDLDFDDDDVTFLYISRHFLYCYNSFDLI